jgi:hypothetical protein
VLVLKRVLLDIIYVQFFSEEFQLIVGVHLVLHHQSAQLVLVHLLHLLVDVDCFALNRHQIFLFFATAGARFDVIFV